MSSPIKITITEEQAGTRADILLVEKSGQSRNQVRRWIDQGHILHNGTPLSKAGIKLSEGDTLEWLPPEPETLDLIPQNIPLEIRHEDSDVIVVNKPAGMVVHPAAGNPDGTLVNALLYHCKDLEPIGGVLRPGIVHRIDKDTSGLLVVAKNERAHNILMEQFAVHSIERKYQAFAYGQMSAPEGTIKGNIGRHSQDRKRFAVVPRGGKHAITHWREIAIYNELVFLELTLETGRTHQIRVHLHHIGHPIVADPIYCPSRRVSHLTDKPLQDMLKPMKRQLLHAAILGFEHPKSGEVVRFEEPLPEDMANLLAWLQERYSQRS